MLLQNQFYSIGPRCLVVVMAENSRSREFVGLNITSGLAFPSSTYNFKNSASPSLAQSATCVTLSRVCDTGKAR